MLYRSIWLIGFVGFCPQALVAQPTYRFTKLTSADGLAHNNVYAITQDYQGFMWFGTEDGLTRYDGYTFKTYKHDPTDTTSLQHNWIWSLYEDQNQQLWVGTFGGGVSRFDQATETFKRYSLDDAHQNPAEYAIIQTFYEDRNEHLWIGTTNHGFYVYDAQTDTFGRPPLHKAEDQVLVHVLNTLLFFEDQDKNLFLGTLEGLLHLNPQRDSLARYIRSPFDYAKKSFPSVTGLLEWSSDTLLVALRDTLFTFSLPEGKFDLYPHTPSSKTPVRSAFKMHAPHPADGFWLYNANSVFWHDRKHGTNQRYYHDPTAKPTNHNALETVYQDRTGMLWLGTRGGVLRWDPATAHIPLYTFASDPDKNFVRSFAEISDESLWIGTHNGVQRKQRATSRKPLFDSHLFPQSTISALLQDSQSRIWVGTWDSGLHRFTPDTQHWTTWTSNPADSTMLLNDGIMALTEDHAGNVWAASWVGLHKFEPATDRLIRYGNGFGFSDTTLALSEVTIFSVYEAPSQPSILWVGTLNGGINRFDVNRQDVTYFQSDATDPTSLGGNSAYAFLEDSRGLFWVGTNAGLERLNRQDGTFTRYTMKDGLVNNTVYCILEDHRGRLWLSTNNGIARFDLATESFANFDIDDGLQGNEYNLNGCLKQHNGRLLFGGRHGYNDFHPDSLQLNASPPAVVFTDFRILTDDQHEHHETTHKASHLPTAITVADHITLPYDQHVFSFEFAALHFANPARNQYAYQLEGLHEDWIHLGTRRSITFTNLQHGTYTLRVKASNKDGVWNEAGASLTLTITPPWWHTGWAYSLFVLMALASILGFTHWRSWQLRRRNQELQHEVEKRTQEVAKRTDEVEKQRAQLQIQNEQLEQQNQHIEQQAHQLKELDAAKSRFFSHISHELRTPLSLILTPLEHVLQGNGIVPQTIRPYLDRAHTNGKKLITLIDELLQLSKLESGTLTLQETPTALIPLIHRLFYAFESLATKKGIPLDFQTTLEPSHSVWLDIEKFEKILNNLVSNAIKYTPAGGRVTLKSMIADEDYIFTIQDTGQGIHPDDLARVFERYFQASRPGHSSEGGMGIGLALAKEYAHLLKGDLHVASTLDEGSIFTLRLPLRQAPDLKHTTGASPTSNKVAERNLPSISYPSPLTSSPTPDAHLLVIEDHPEMAAQLKQILSPSYAVTLAQDGIEGLVLCRSATFDLVISDVMMPRMDGFELLQMIRQDKTLSSLPVILLTARADEDDRLQGLRLGIDDYITKPFSTAELLVRVQNILRNRGTDHQSIATLDTDQQFLQAAEQYVLDRLSDPTLSMADVAAHLNVSERHLRRTLKKLTGLSAIGFVRETRLLQAYRMMAQKEHATVAEVSHAVGFATPFYFSKLFLKRFGKRPQEMLR